MCKFQITESKANAHAGMPFCGVSRFVVSAIWLIYGCFDQWQQPVWGVGRLRLSFIGIAEPHLDKCIDSRLFVFSLNLAKFLQSEANSIGVNDGGFLWLGTKMAT